MAADSSSNGSSHQHYTAAPPAPAPHDHGHAQRSCLLPAEIYDHIVEGGEAKHRNSLLREVLLGFMAGAFICFGFATCMIAAGQIPEHLRHDNPGLFNLLFGAYGFPVGLAMCVINGASLFTSNIAYMTAALMERRASGWQAARVVWLSYFTNLAGCLFLVQLMLSGDVFKGRSDFTVYLATKKVSSSFGATLTKGILCNWLVCIAVWQGNAAQDITGKLLGIWFPISAFVTSGYEHCVANMFVIPLGMRLGAPITVGDFLAKNLIPSTLGNLIGGGVFVAMMMGLSFGSAEKRLNEAAARGWHRLGGPDAALGCCFGAAHAAPSPAAVAGAIGEDGGRKDGAAAAAASAGGGASSDGDDATAAVVARLCACKGGCNGGLCKSSSAHPAA